MPTPLYRIKEIDGLFYPEAFCPQRGWLKLKGMPVRNTLAEAKQFIATVIRLKDGTKETIHPYP